MEKLIGAAFLVLLAFGALAQDIYKMPAGSQSRVSSLENLNGLKGQGGKSNAGAKGNAFCSLRFQLPDAVYFYHDFKTRL